MANLAAVAVGAVKVQSAMQQAQDATAQRSRELIQQLHTAVDADTSDMDEVLRRENVQYHPAVNNCHEGMYGGTYCTQARPGYYSKLDPGKPVSAAWLRVIIRSEVQAGKVGAE